MRLLKRAALVLVALILAAVAWGVLIEPRLILVEEEEVATIPGLPRAWEGERVALIADLQIGMWLDNDGMVRRIVAEIVEERPAVALIAGDFVYGPGEDPGAEIGAVVDLLRPLAEAGIPTYAVLGNHDYAMVRPDGDADYELATKVASALEGAGIRVLENEAVRLGHPSIGGAGGGAPLYLVGTGAAWPGRDRPILSLDQVPDGAPRLAMMHNPNTFAEFPAGAAPFAVAGHTHGGQVRVPGLPAWSWLTYVERDRVHADGWIEGYGAPGNHLYVNRGIGFSLLPVRINCPPELTLFTLGRAGS